MNFREKILASAARRKSRTVLALDLGGDYDSRLTRAEQILEAAKEEIAAVKINHHLILPYGLRGLKQVVARSSREQLPLIADLKMNDIESTNLNIVDSLLDFGFDAVIANPFVGWDEGLGRAVEAIHAKGGGMILLVYMSHRGTAEGYSLRSEEGEPFFRRFARRAREWGADGVVVSAKSPDKIAEVREIVGNEILIFSPGVGAQGGTSAPALGAGADFAIVGRSITESGDPRAAARSINAK